ncbi:MAG: CvpA family protein [Alicyclobacillus herbarius]|nr:CvpA family protein [Alicyclobacillus herbarius]
MDMLDLIIGIVVLLAAWKGYQQGLFREVMRLVGVGVAYVGALWLRPYIAPILAQTHWIPHTSTPGIGQWLGDANSALAFFLAFVVIFVVVRVLIGFLDTVFRLPVLSQLNRLAGLVASVVFALAVMYVLTLVLHYVPNSRVQQQLNQSKIASWFEQRHFAVTTEHAASNL